MKVPIINIKTGYMKNQQKREKGEVDDKMWIKYKQTVSEMWVFSKARGRYSTQKGTIYEVQGNYIRLSGYLFQDEFSTITAESLLRNFEIVK